MSVPAAVQYRVEVKKDPETGSVVAEIPALQLAEYGADVPEALDRLQAMLTFHLDCLREEGKPLPASSLPPSGALPAAGFPCNPWMKTGRARSSDSPVLRFPKWHQPSRV
jgi:predicted RNase H-like HicB family nuclease